MNELIINMIKNKNCSIPERVCVECVSISVCLALLLGVDTFIEEVCYDTLLWEITKKVIILSAIILIVVIKVSKYINSKINHISLESNKKLIQANFNVKEFKAIGSYGRISCTYYIVGYYTEENRTYRFDCEIYDNQQPVSDVFGYIQKHGVFPEKIDVYVDATNYNNYEMQVYEFLDATLKMNKELAEYAYDNVKYGMDIGQYKKEKEHNRV